MNNRKIGVFIAECRREKNLTQRQLAEQLHVTNKAVSKWETGRCLPDASLFAPLCAALGISVNELLAGEKIERTESERFFEQNIQQITVQYQKNARRRSIVIAALSTVIVILLMAACFIAMAIYLFGFPTSSDESSVKFLNTRWHLSLSTQLEEQYHYREGFEDAVTLYVFDDPEGTITDYTLKGGEDAELEAEVQRILDGFAEADSAYFPDFSHAYLSAYRDIGDKGNEDMLYCLYDTQLKKLYLIEIIL